jgi:hypothetical protein
MFDQVFERSDALRRQFAGPLREARLDATKWPHVGTCDLRGAHDGRPGRAASAGLRSTRPEANGAAGSTL